MAQSINNEISFGTQVRKSPYFDATVRWGAKGFSVYNHMYIPRDFGDAIQNFWNLVNEAILVMLRLNVKLKLPALMPVSYTHLTLPTILLV